jgi:hypothetical protein
MPADGGTREHQAQADREDAEGVRAEPLRDQYFRLESRIQASPFACCS